MSTGVLICFQKTNWKEENPVSLLGYCVKANMAMGKNLTLSCPALAAFVSIVSRVPCHLSSRQLLCGWRSHVDQTDVQLGPTSQ